MRTRIKHKGNINATRAPSLTVAEIIRVNFDRGTFEADRAASLNGQTDG